MSAVPPLQEVLSRPTYSSKQEYGRLPRIYKDGRPMSMSKVVEELNRLTEMEEKMAMANFLSK